MHTVPTEAPHSHAQLAAALRTRVEQTGTLDAALRRDILMRAAGGPAVPEPYDALVNQIAEDSYRVTDAQVEAVLEASGYEKNAFEVILTASIGAGLRRWDAAANAIQDARDAPA